MFNIEHARFEIGGTFVEGAGCAFRSNKTRADNALMQLNDDTLHFALDPNSNDIETVMKHVGGNLLSRWTNSLTTNAEGK